MSKLSADVHLLDLGGGESLSYTIRHTGRRKTVGVFVEPDGRVAVFAPTSAKVGRIEQVMLRRMKWIRRNQRLVEGLSAALLPREWVAGETHRYLGRQYRLRPIKGDPSSVKLVGGYFLVTVSDPGDRARIQELMERWYKEHAVALLTDRVERIIATSTWLKRKAPPIRIRHLKNRWGSTTAAGCITFNTDLVKLSLSCIDYVVAHELVHLMIPSHSPAFWRMLGRVMPDWRRWQTRLSKVEI